MDIMAFPERVVPGVEHSFVEVSGLRVHVAQCGQGEPLLLLHGFPQNWWEWRDVITPLASHYRVICPDFRGAGESDAPAGGYTSDHLLADTLGLMNALGLDQVHILAHDYGALIAFRLCLEYPERVHRFVALSVPHPFLKPSLGFLGVLKTAWIEPVIAAPILGPALLGSRRQKFPRFLFAHFSHSENSFASADLEYFLAGLRVPARARAGSALYRHCNIPTFVDIFAGRFRKFRLSTPTLMLIGTEDPPLKPAMLGGYEPYADDLTVEFLPDASHFLVDDVPKVVARRALEFLSRD
ncbi:alpha/beta fold hydrolase [Arthrobacter psychrolactophilus]